MSGSPHDWNAGIIAEFRKNHGKVGGQFEGAPILLINHSGARTGKPRTNPVMYLKDGHRYLVFASKGGADTNPDWYHNLKAHANVKIEVGNETIEVRAEEITGPERDKLYTGQASLYPQFAQYQKKTKRTIPVIAFTPFPQRLRDDPQNCSPLGSGGPTLVHRKRMAKFFGLWESESAIFCKRGMS